MLFPQIILLFRKSTSSFFCICSAKGSHTPVFLLMTPPSTMPNSNPNPYPHALQSLNSFNISASAADYIQLSSLKDIENLCASLYLKQKPFYILGGGSNTLFVRDFPGRILHVTLSGIEVTQETCRKAFVKAAAGVSWNQLVLFCIENGYGGIENLSLIPGTVGGATVQNVGAYGVELNDVLHSVEAIELSTGKSIIFNPSACGFGYRSSFFKTIWQNRYLITSITLALHKEDKFSIEYGGIREMLAKMGITKLSFKAVSDAVIAIRKQKLPDPAVLGNAGSFFQNPFISTDFYRQLKQQHPNLIAFKTEDKEKRKVSAGWLIEAAGFKGVRMGRAGVSKSHALVLVNYGGASGEEVLNLATQIKQKVKHQFDVSLTMEVTIVNIEEGGNLSSKFK